MPHILGKIGLEEVDLPDHSTLVKAFDRFQMKVWRVLLRLSAQLHDSQVTPPPLLRSSTVKLPASTTAAGRIIAFKHSKRPLSSIQNLKLSLTFTVRPRKPMTHSSADQVACVAAGDLASLAADKGYDWMDLREELREEDVRLLIKHHIFRPIDHAHNARADASISPTADV